MEVVCLSSDEDEKDNLPVIVSTRSCANVEILSDSDSVVNGKTDTKTEEKRKECDDAEPEPSTSTSGQPAKKRRGELITIENPEPAQNKGTSSSQKKSKRAILIEENKMLFEKLLKKCEEVEDTPDMQKGTAKAQRHFDSAQVEFICSKEFKNTVQETLTKIDKQCVWGHLGEIVKQLKLYKEIEDDLCGSQKEKDSIKEKLAANDKDRYYRVLKTEEDDRIVSKLSKILKKIHKQILKLETKEVDFEDDNDSVYMMLERYKARAAKIYEKLSQLTNLPEHADRMSKRKITFSGTNIVSINRCIERFLNKNNTFPDYHDVLKLIKTVNTSESLGLSDGDVNSMASKAFRDIGRELKKRRQWDVEDSLYYHLDRKEFDPKEYESDAELQSKLDENGKNFVAKFNNLIEDYTQRQLKKAEPEKEKAENEDGANGDGANGDNSGASSQANSDTEKDDDDDDEEGEEEEESDDEAAELEKPVDEEFESDNERMSEDETSSGDEEPKEHSTKEEEHPTKEEEHSTKEETDVVEVKDPCLAE